MSCTSRRRTWVLLMKYEDSPSRWSTLFTEISAYCDHCPAALPRLLSNINSTLARATGLRKLEPLKITSCIESPRKAAARDSPSTQRTASMMLDLPQPFGPTTPTSFPGMLTVVGSTKDLKPASLIWVSRTLADPDKRKPARGKSEQVRVASQASEDGAFKNCNACVHSGRQPYSELSSGRIHRRKTEHI